MSRKRLRQGEGWTLVSSCPECGQPETECRCESSPAPTAERVVRLRLEKRRGKAVTVLHASGYDEPAFRELLKTLKSRCATGGTVRKLDGELQGDHREKVRKLLEGDGVRVKG